MKTLKTLIKLNKNELDKIRKRIDHFEVEKVKLELEKSRIELELSEEIKKYSAGPYAYMLDRYTQNSRESIKRLNSQIQQYILEIEVLREALRNQYSELKKLEIALSNKNKLELDKQRKVEVKMLDEVSINKFVRKKLN